MVYSKYFETDSKMSLLLDKLKKFFNVKYIVFILMSFLFSFQTINSEYSIFSIVILGLATLFNVPLLLVMIPTGIGSLISGISKTGSIEIIGIFCVFTLLTAIINIEGISKKYEILLKLIISFITVTLITNIVSSTLFTNLFSTIQDFLLMIIFYMIFSSGMYVLINFKDNYVFSQEEKIAMVVMLSIATLILKDVTIYNISIMNILLLIIFLVYGWKNGIILGGISGIATGLLLMVASDINIVNVLMLGFSGLISGVLSKFGKISVIIGFIVGNIYIIFYASGISDITLRISEVLAASTVLLLIPKKLELKLWKIFNQNRTLVNPYQNTLDVASQTKEKINTVSSIFDELSDLVDSQNIEDKNDIKKIIKRYMLDFIECSCLNCANKKECKNSERINLVVERVADKLVNNEKVEASIFADLECRNKEELAIGIEEVYSNIRVMKLLKQKEVENNKKIASQYKEVSNILKSLAKNVKMSMQVNDQNHLKLRDELKLGGYRVYEDDYSFKDGVLEYTFVTDILTNIDKQKKNIVSIIEQVMCQKVTVKLILNTSKTEKSKVKVITIPKYEIKNIINSIIKEGEEVSGDSYLSYELSDKKYAVILSDGASSGDDASKNSSMIISTLEKLFSSGFDADKSIEIINSIINLKSDDNNFATVDAAMIDLNSANLTMIKLGAAPSYVLDEDGKLTTISSMALPAGLLEDDNFVPITKQLASNSVLVQITDGALNESEDISNNFITEYLKTVDVKKPIKVISEELNKLISKQNKEIKDDITVSVTKIELSK